MLMMCYMAINNLMKVRRLKYVTEVTLKSNYRGIGGIGLSLFVRISKCIVRIVTLGYTHVKRMSMPYFSASRVTLNILKRTAV